VRSRVFCLQPKKNQCETYFLCELVTSLKGKGTRTTSQTRWPCQIDHMLYIYILCPHSEHQNNPFQSKKSKHFHQRNRFTQCETGSIKVKLPKVGSNVIVPVPVGAGPNKDGGKKEDKGIQEGREGKPRGLCQG
jgi:hypothetical protein